jgi:hypothetical protein
MSYPMKYNIDKKCHIDNEVVNSATLLLTWKTLDLTFLFSPKITLGSAQSTWHFHVRKKRYCEHKIALIACCSKHSILLVETCLSDSLSRPAPRDYPAFEPTVGSDERIDPNCEVTSDGGKASKTRKMADVWINAAPMRKKTTTKTITRRWQEVWSCKFTWAEGEFDAYRDLIGIVCQSCNEISGRKKILVSKGDNLEKHKGKRTCKDDGVPLHDLKKGDLYMKVDYKHNKFCKLWAGRK